MDFCTWALIVTTWLTLGEMGNCVYPRLEDDYNSEGMLCSWEDDDFYLDEKTDKWVLNKTDDDDNCVEGKVRERYWKGRDKK